MKISLELSLYPLDDNFLNIIRDIVERLNANCEVSCLTNSMSTQIFGEFSTVMQLLNETLYYSFSNYGKQVFVAKFLNNDLTPSFNNHV